eukprot:Sspe_Gene.27486::Locus_11878_Transcript_1_1_Confidence_1.000_Length_1477::g.27486::m.27486
MVTLPRPYDDLPKCWGDSDDEFRISPLRLPVRTSTPSREKRASEPTRRPPPPRTRRLSPPPPSLPSDVAEGLALANDIAVKYGVSGREGHREKEDSLPATLADVRKAERRLRAAKAAKAHIAHRQHAALRRDEVDPDAFGLERELAENSVERMEVLLAATRAAAGGHGETSLSPHDEMVVSTEALIDQVKALLRRNPAAPPQPTLMRGTEPLARSTMATHPETLSRGVPALLGGGPPSQADYLRLQQHVAELHERCIQLEEALAGSRTGAPLPWATMSIRPPLLHTRVTDHHPRRRPPNYKAAKTRRWGGPPPPRSSSTVSEASSLSVSTQDGMAYPPPPLVMKKRADRRLSSSSSSSSGHSRRQHKGVSAEGQNGGAVGKRRRGWGRRGSEGRTATSTMPSEGGREEEDSLWSRTGRRYTGYRRAGSEVGGSQVGKYQPRPYDVRRREEQNYGEEEG